MTKREFIRKLVEADFCSVLEAEEYLVYCGADGWYYSDPFSTKRAYLVNNQLILEG